LGRTGGADDFRFASGCHERVSPAYINDKTV
jgi:hypothetical protein